MNRLLLILLLAAATAHGQINNPPTSVNIVDSTATGRAVLTATNAAAAATAIGLGVTNEVTFSKVDAGSINSSGFVKIDVDDMYLFNSNGYGNVALDWGGASLVAGLPISFTTNTAAATTRTNLGLGATNNVTFSNITASGIIHAKDSTASPSTNSSLARGIQWTNLAGFHAAIYANYVGVPQITIAAGASNAFSDVASFRSTGMTVSSNAIVGGTLAVSNTANFATNVTVAGSLSVGSFSTTTPSTWALDATQTAAATNGVLTLPSNANVLRITNANTISAISNGILGAFYFLINQSGTNVVISNSATITARGATNITLGANESATLISTTATNATAH